MNRLAYIASASHSGSTLMAMLLGGHPDACTVGELRLANVGDAKSYLCSCGVVLEQCHFWCSVQEGMVRRGFPGFSPVNAGTNMLGASGRYAQFLLQPLHRGWMLETVRDVALGFDPGWRRHLRESLRANVALIGLLQEQTRAKVIVDSSKLPLRLKYLLRATELETKVIRLVRDGRAVALTYTDEWTFADASDPSLRSGGLGVRRSPPHRSMHDAAREWKRSNESADCLVARLPRSQWLRVRYEDVCSQPRQTLEHVCSFLELDPAKFSLDFRAKPHHVIGNGMRLDRASEIKLDDRWRNALSSDDLRVFDSVAGELNRTYGYE